MTEVLLWKKVSLSTLETGFDWCSHSFNVCRLLFQKTVINHIIKEFHAMESWNKHNTDRYLCITTHDCTVVSWHFIPSKFTFCHQDILFSTVILKQLNERTWWSAIIYPFIFNILDPTVKNLKMFCEHHSQNKSYTVFRFCFLWCMLLIESVRTIFSVQGHY
jgi:hypothetical protein